MFVLLDGRITDIYVLQEIEIIEDTTNAEWNVISNKLPEDRNVMKSFSQKVDAETYINRAQDAIAANEHIQFIDLRTDDEG